MLSEKNNEFNCLKATTFVTQVWIIENIFKEKSLQNVGCDSACSFSSHTAAHRDTHSPVLRATNLATLHTFSQRVNEVVKDQIINPQIIQMYACVDDVCPRTVVSQAGLERDIQH